MSTLSKTYTITNGTTNDAAQVEQDLNDIITYINANAVVKDATTAFTAIPSGPATDPTTANQLTRKSYVDVIAQKSTPTITSTALDAKTYSNGTGSTALTITDPGYNITVWGSAIACFVSQGQTTTWSIWGISIYVDGVQKDQLMVPFSIALAGLPLSLGLPLRHTAHSTGTNCTVQVIMNLLSGDGSLVLNASSPRNNLETFYVRA